VEIYISVFYPFVYTIKYLFIKNKVKYPWVVAISIGGRNVHMRSLYAKRLPPIILLCSQALFWLLRTLYFINSETKCSIKYNTYIKIWLTCGFIAYMALPTRCNKDNNHPRPQHCTEQQQNSSNSAHTLFETMRWTSDLWVFISTASWIIGIAGIVGLYALSVTLCWHCCRVPLEELTDHHRNQCNQNLVCKHTLLQ